MFVNVNTIFFELKIKICKRYFTFNQPTFLDLKIKLLYNLLYIDKTITFGGGFSYGH